MHVKQTGIDLSEQTIGADNTYNILQLINDHFIVYDIFNGAYPCRTGLELIVMVTAT